MAKRRFSPACWNAWQRCSGDISRDLLSVCAGGVPQPVPLSSKALAAQERLRKLQQLQRLARPGPRRCGSSAGSSEGQAFLGASCSQTQGGCLAPPDLPASACAEARSLEDILQRASALLAGPSAWDPLPDGPAIGHGTSARAQAADQCPAPLGDEDECVDALIQRAWRLLEQGAAEASSACSSSGSRGGWREPVSAAADAAPAAEVDMLAAFLARAQPPGTAGRASGEAYGESKHEAGIACAVKAAEGLSEHFDSTGACSWLHSSDLMSKQPCDAAAVSAAAATGQGDAQAWQRWLAQEVSTWESGP